jgi:hypothetical protein
MVNAIPSPVAPCPLASLSSKHERHNENAEGDEDKQRNEGAVAYAPDPMKKESAPIPSVEFVRDFYRIVVSALVSHGSSRNEK